MNNLKKLIFIRAAVGLYYLLILALLLSIRKMIYFTPGKSIIPTIIFRNLFDAATSTQLSFAFVFASVAALLFILGFVQQIAAVTMYLALLFFVHANTLLMEIHYTYLGWLLLVFALSPQFTTKFKNAEHEAILHWWANQLTTMALFALGISFSYLGLVKLLYPAYYKADLANFLLAIPDAHPHLIGPFDFLNTFLRTHLSDNFKILLGLAGAVAELVIFPLICFRKLRFLAHVLVFAVLLYIGILVNYWHIALLMLIFQITAFDINPKKLKTATHEWG